MSPTRRPPWNPSASPPALQRVYLNQPLDEEEYQQTMRAKRELSRKQSHNRRMLYVSARAFSSLLLVLVSHSEAAAV